MPQILRLFDSFLLALPDTVEPVLLQLLEGMTLREGVKALE